MAITQPPTTSHRLRREWSQTTRFEPRGMSPMLPCRLADQRRRRSVVSKAYQCDICGDLSTEDPTLRVQDLGTFSGIKYECCSRCGKKIRAIVCKLRDDNWGKRNGFKVLNFVDQMLSSWCKDGDQMREEVECVEGLAKSKTTSSPAEVPTKSPPIAAAEQEKEKV